MHIEEFFRLGPEAVAAEARRIVGDGPAYVSFDVDGLDPVYAPGTGTPEIGGFSTAEAQQMIRGLGGIDLVGGDVVEVSPPFDPSGNTALVGATMMFEILCVLAPAVHRRRHRSAAAVSQITSDAGESQTAVQLVPRVVCTVPHCRKPLGPSWAKIVARLSCCTITSAWPLLNTSTASAIW